ncbi:MAG: hypothetical protein ACK4XY_08655 [Chloroherpetonaceae bacterium]
MKSDTSPEMQARYRQMLMARTPEERFKMGLSACEAARKLVLASLPPDLDETERRVQLFLRYYKNDFTPSQQEKIIASLRQYGKAHANPTPPLTSAEVPSS